MKNKHRSIVVAMLILLVLTASCIVAPGTPSDYNPGVTEDGSCPTGYPVDCGGYCCPEGFFCNPSASEGEKCYRVPDTELNVCPEDYPVKCDGWCCPTGLQCGQQDECFDPESPYQTDECIDDEDCETGCCVENDEGLRVCGDCQ